MTDRKLTLDDIADLRAYERERPAFLQHVLALKARRRISVGPLVTFVFENRDTIRFQVQEMARVEKIISDAAIQTELDIYNPLIPAPGQLSSTMFVELTTSEALREWLPKLVGIERHVLIRLRDGTEIRAEPDPEHDRQLTRDDVTSTVHYVRFALAPAQIDAFAAGDVDLVVDHPAYHEQTLLGPDTIRELLTDLRV